MDSLQQKINENVLNQLLSWGKDIIDFENHYAKDGLFIAEGFFSESSDENLFLLAINVAFWCWFDDRSDKYLKNTKTSIDWETLINITQKKVINVQADTPEVDFFIKMSLLMQNKAKSNAEYDWWLKTASCVFRAVCSEEQITKFKGNFSYSECIEIGSYSIGLPNVMSTMYLIYGMNRLLRIEDIYLMEVERYLYLSQRLLNDLRSAKKERHEGLNGRISNSILFLEQIMPPEAAWNFVESQYIGYESLLETSLNLLGENDPFANLIRNMKFRIHRWYENYPLRYEA